MAWLLLLLMLQLLHTVNGELTSKPGQLNLTDCDTRKACWVSEDCAKKPRTEFYGYYLRKDENDFKLMKRMCSRYLIVEPGAEHFEFEMMHDGVGKNTEFTLVYNGDARSSFTCKNHKAATIHKTFAVENLPINHEPNHAFCHFKVTTKTQSGDHRAFYTIFQQKFDPATVAFKYTQDEIQNIIQVDDYNAIHFKGRVPCSSSVFFPEGLNADFKMEYMKKPNHDVSTRKYSCPESYALSYKIEGSNSFKIMNIIDEEVFCNYGEVMLIRVSDTGSGSLVSSAKCHRNRDTLCEEVCSNCVGLNYTISAGKRTMKCVKAPFMVLNGYQVTRESPSCSARSKPTEHIWDWTGFPKRKSESGPISRVECVDKLDCNDIAPFGDCDAPNCQKANFSGGVVKCDNGGQLRRYDSSSKSNVKIGKIECDTSSGQWKIDGKTNTQTRNATGMIKVGCVSKVETTTAGGGVQPAAAQTDLVIIGGVIGGLLLLALIVLLLYCICCRKARRKEEPSKPEPPPTPAPPTKTESSVVEEPIQPPPPIVSNESADSGPAPYSGKRVQMINVSKEHLREIEPDEDPNMEYSAKDKTDSTRSQASQVGATTDAGITFTGRGTGTEATNDASRTMAPGDDTRSDVSRGGNSTVGDQSETGPGGNTPTIGDAEKQRKREKKERKGPKVAFRDRVSYESETKTRDRTSTLGSMHTAPEQPAPVVDRTQQATVGGDPSSQSSAAESRKKDPSRLNADSARKAFGTRTTQNTRETNDDPNRSNDSTVGNRSRVTDVSRTG